VAENHSTVLWDVPPEKFCPKCRSWKILDKFYRLNNKPGTKIKDRKTGEMRDKRTHTSWCIDCRLVKSHYERKKLRESGEQAIINKRWYKNVRKRVLRSRYGMTPEEYDAMLKTQNGVCAICSQPETTKHKKGTAKSLSVDHDHKTGKRRDLLCHNCNCGLGRFMDDPIRLENAAAYLRRHETK
jgi:hypothetical protein